MTFLFFNREAQNRTVTAKHKILHDVTKSKRMSTCAPHNWDLTSFFYEDTKQKEKVK